jgi:hypothetical protein
MQFVVIILVLFASTAVADTVTVFDRPAGIFDDLHAQFAIERDTGRAYIEVFLMEENSYDQCWANQAAMQGISSDGCRVHTRRIKVPSLAYNDANHKFTFKGETVGQDALKTDIHYAEIDNGISIDSVKYVRVQVQTP